MAEEEDFVASGNKWKRKGLLKRCPQVFVMFVELEVDSWLGSKSLFEDMEDIITFWNADIKYADRRHHFLIEDDPRFLKYLTGSTVDRCLPCLKLAGRKVPKASLNTAHMPLHHKKGAVALAKASRYLNRREKVWRK